MLTILTTHPIQYQVPLWQALARNGRVPFEVWYMSDHATRESRDREFGQSFAWDLQMLEGYPYRFIKVKKGATPNTPWKMRFDESFANLLREHGVKTLWVNGWQVTAYWQATWIAHRLGIPVWLRGESNNLAPQPVWKRTVKRVLLGQLFRRVDHFLCIGTANRDLYRDYGVPESKLHVAPYAVDNERFARQASEIRNEKGEIRKGWGIPEDAFCVLFCGKFIPKKRPMDLIRAAQLLISPNSASRTPHPALAPLHLLFVGSGELGTEMRAACNVAFDAYLAQTPDLRTLTSEMKPSASFPGFLNQTEISRAYVAADCLVLPSDHGETWGLVVNEAMASGLPCIISDRVGCAADLGALGPNRVYHCGDEAKLACALAQCCPARERVSSPPSLDETREVIEMLWKKIGSQA